MQSDRRRLLAWIEVDPDGLADIALQLGQIDAVGGDAAPSRLVPVSREYTRLFVALNGESNLIHRSTMTIHSRPALTPSPTGHTIRPVKPTAIAAKEFEADCQKLIDEVAQDGKPLVITKEGKPVARLMPFRELPPMRGDWAGKVEIHGDIVYFDTSDDWEALK